MKWNLWYSLSCGEFVLIFQIYSGIYSPVTIQVTSLSGRKVRAIGRKRDLLGVLLLNFKQTIASPSPRNRGLWGIDHKQFTSFFPVKDIESKFISRRGDTTALLPRLKPWRYTGLSCSIVQSPPTWFITVHGKLLIPTKEKAVDKLELSVSL